MAYNLFDLTLMVAKELGAAREGIATANSTANTLKDSVELTQDDDYWNGGTVWCTYDAGGASAAPEGEYSRITDFANTGGIATLVLSSTYITTGDRYCIATSEFPLNQIISAINASLTEFGLMLKVTTTSVQIDIDKTEYSLPADCYDLRKVWIQGQTTDTNDNQWTEVRNWMVQKSAIGTADVLVLPYQYSDDYYLKLEFLAKHPSLNVYTDKLHEWIDPRLVKWGAICSLLDFKYNQTKRDEYLTRWNKAMARYQEYKQSLSKRLPRKPGIRMAISHSTGSTMEDSEPDTVYLK